MVRPEGTSHKKGETPFDCTAHTRGWVLTVGEVRQVRVPEHKQIYLLEIAEDNGKCVLWCPTSNLQRCGAHFLFVETMTLRSWQSRSGTTLSAIQINARCVFFETQDAGIGWKTNDRTNCKALFPSCPVATLLLPRKSLDGEGIRSWICSRQHSGCANASAHVCRSYWNVCVCVCVCVPPERA